MQFNILLLSIEVLTLSKFVEFDILSHLIFQIFDISDFWNFGIWHFYTEPNYQSPTGSWFCKQMDNIVKRLKNLKTNLSTYAKNCYCSYLNDDVLEEMESLPFCEVSNLVAWKYTEHKYLAAQERTRTSRIFRFKRL